MWGPILEKAWAKVKGSYTNILDQGFVQNGIRAITGIPVFTYETIDIANEEQLGDTYKLLEAANFVNYIMGLASSSETVEENNACGVKVDYAYSILSVFKMEDLSGRYH